LNNLNRLKGENSKTEEIFATGGLAFSNKIELIDSPVISESVKLDCKNTSNLFLLSILLLFCI
jgi:hypothetical protein